MQELKRVLDDCLNSTWYHILRPIADNILQQDHPRNKPNRISSSKIDKKIVIEKAVIGREIECAILGKDGDLVASVLGEVISMGSHEFYDYEAKYFDENGSRQERGEF